MRSVGGGEGTLARFPLIYPTASRRAPFFSRAREKTFGASFRSKCGSAARKGEGDRANYFNAAASRASFSIPAQSPASISFFGTIHEPPRVMTLASFR